MVALEAPQDNTDRNRGRGPPERNRQTKEAMAELGAKEAAMAAALQGAQEAMAVQGLRRPWRCRELRRPWQVVLVAVASVPSARPLQPEPFYPPKNFPGEVRGYQEPSGARHTGQYMDSPPGLNTQEQDRTDLRA